MCFGGGSNNDAKKALNWQKQQAADAARKEAERQARLKEGTTLINSLFDGSPVMGTRQVNYDWTAFNDAAARAQQGGASSGSGSGVSTVGNSGSNSGSGSSDWTFGDIVGATAGFPRGTLNLGETRSGGTNGSDGSGGSNPFSGVTLPPGFTVRTVSNGRDRPPTYQLVGPDGQVYNPGQLLQYDEQYDTGNRAGGFGDSFYNNYRNAALNYYLPELQKQFRKAKSNLTFDHARAGTLQSSMASENLADLLYQNTSNEALVRSKADNATSQLRTSVAAQKQAALGQLYATEDPSIAANTATNSVRTLQNTTPEFSPMGQLFTNAIVGASNFASAYDDYRNWGTPPGNSGGSGRIVN